MRRAGCVRRYLTHPIQTPAQPSTGTAAKHGGKKGTTVWRPQQQQPQPQQARDEHNPPSAASNVTEVVTKVRHCVMQMFYSSSI